MTDASLAPGGPDRRDSIRAAEYVLHLLDPAERRDFEGRLGTSGGLRALVAEWTESFARLSNEVREATPPAAIRGRLERFATGERTAASPARTRRGRLAGLFGGLVGGLAMALAAIVVLLLVLPQGLPPAIGPVYTAQIAAEDGSFLIEARYAEAANRLDLARQEGGPPPGRVMQLWLLPAGADAPLAVAVLPETDAVSLDLSAEIGAGIPGGLLEISEEPPGGSPEAGPTGSVLGLGTVDETPA